MSKVSESGEVVFEDGHSATRRWEPCDMGYISSYGAGPIQVLVTPNFIQIQNLLRSEMRPDETRWLAARLAESVGIWELLNSINSNPRTDGYYSPRPLR